MSYIVSWSGGKDSCFACYKAIREGYKVSHLINFILKENKKIKLHRISEKLIQLQAESIGIPLIQKEIKWESYEKEFKKSVKVLIPNGIKGIIFGDMYVQEYTVQKHKDWVEKVCGDLGVEAIEPLWELDPEIYLLELIDMGFEAIIISSKVDLFGKEWIGRKLDKNFLEYLKNNNIDICGEKGEYHTFVIDCPLFKKKIKINKSKPFLRDNYWFLDILEYSL